MKASEWIDRVKLARGWESDYRAAKELGLSRALVSKYRGPTSTFDEETAIKVAEALGADPAGIIIDQVAERAKNPAVQSALREAANQRLYIMLTNIIGALSKAAVALPPLLMPGVKSARTRHA